MKSSTVAEKIVTCLECDRTIKLNRKAVVDDLIVCGHCGTNFVIIEVGPLELDYADDGWSDQDWGDPDDWEDDDWGDDDD